MELTSRDILKVDLDYLLTNKEFEKQNVKRYLNVWKNYLIYQIKARIKFFI